MTIEHCKYKHLWILATTQMDRWTFNIVYSTIVLIALTVFYLIDDIQGFLWVKGTFAVSLPAVYCFGALTWNECGCVCVCVCVSFSFFLFFLQSVSDMLAAQVNIWPNLCAGGWSAQRKEPLCHCTCFLLNKSLLYSRPWFAFFLPPFFFRGDWCTSEGAAKVWWLEMVLLIRRNDHGIDNISNKLIIKGFPVEVVIFSEMGLC